MGNIRVKLVVVVLQVASLLDKMECLSVSHHINIHTALKRHHMAICVTQARRKEEIANMLRCHEQATHSTEYRGKALCNHRHMFLSLSLLMIMYLFLRLPVVGHSA